MTLLLKSRFSLLVLAIAAMLFASCSESETPADQAKAALVESTPEPVLAGLAWNHPEACFECHQDTHADWAKSHHALANRRVRAEKESLAFSIGEVVDEAGIQYEISKTDDGYLIDDLSLKGHPIDAVANVPVDSVIGETPIWQYLVPFPRGRFQTHGLTWDSQKNEWFNVFGEERRDPGDWGHWTGQGMNWNSNCAYCHMTDFKKNYDFRTDSYDSQWQIEAISCIQCHSGMEQHVADARKGAYEPAPVATEEDLQVAMENCAICHSRRETLTMNAFKAGDDYDEHFRMVLPDVPGLYFENGLALEEDYVWTSFRLSKMGHAGVTCFDCHDKHTTKTKVPPSNNALCMQCHTTGLKGAGIIDEATHSHHPVGSTGAQCVECHMPERVYMGRDPRRDHGFTLPSPTSTLERGEPNACTQCHTGESAEWASEHFTEWFGETERMKELEDRADVMHRAHIDEAGAWKDLIRLFDNEDNPYWRSTYMRMLANHPEEEDALQRALKARRSKNPVEKDAAMMLLARRQDRLADVQGGLTDPSRMVRIRAAEALQSSYNGNQLAYREWKEMIEMTSDRPAGALRRAELALREGEAALARQLALQAVNFDGNNAPLKYDAAIILDRAGDIQGALKLLDKGRMQDPKLAVLAYAQGLIRAEGGDLKGAIESLEDAVALSPEQGRWWYNLSVSYYQINNFAKAIEAAEKVLELDPNSQEAKQIIELSNK